MKTVVAGLQWGDEGKGKVVQHFSRLHDWVVRFSGGPNAGHTVYYGDRKTVHHLVPSSVIGKELFIGRGTLVDLGILNEEIETMTEISEDFRNHLHVSPWCRVITPIEKKIDMKLEELKGPNPIGTTKRGIGPTVADDAHRFGIRLFDLLDEKKAKEKFETLAAMSEPLIGKIDPEETADSILAEFEKTRGMIGDAVPDGNVLFEGTQAILLDPMYGTYPYVTSTSCMPSSAFYGAGLPISDFETLGVFKAYVTRVGAGPFPTELFDEDGEKIRNAGGEFGATTGRPRRCGWLDLPLLKYSCEAADTDRLVMTKADVMNGFERVGVCTRYGSEPKLYDLEGAKPHVEYVKGWKSLEDSSFANFISMIEKETGRKIDYISTGPMESDIKEL